MAFDPKKLEEARKELVFDPSKLNDQVFTPEQMQETPPAVQPSYAEVIRAGFAQEPLPEGTSVGRKAASIAAENILPTIGAVAGAPAGPAGIAAGAAAGRAAQKAGVSLGNLFAGRAQKTEDPNAIVKDVALTGALQAIGTGTVGLNKAATGLPKQFTGIKGAMQGLSKGTESLAVNEINALLKPKSSAYLFGKNPGKGVVDEGITGKTFEEVAQGISNKLDEVGAQYAPILKKYGNRRLNLANFTKPIDEALEVVKKDPRSHKEVINRLENIKRDLMGAFDDLTTGEAFYPNKFTNVTAKVAQDLKQRIGVLTKFTGESGEQTAKDKYVNTTLKRIYGAIDSKLDSVIPGLKDLNARYANLLGAHVAAVNRNAATMNRRNLAPLAEAVAGAGIGAIAGHPITGAILGAGTAGTHMAMTSPWVITKGAQALSKTVAPALATGAEKLGGAQVPQTIIRLTAEEDPLGLFQ